MFTSMIQIFLLLISIVACSSNPFKEAESKDTAEDATIYLEKQKPQKAIDLLEKALVDDPDNYTYKSLLSMAYAQRAGVDPLTLAQNVASGTGTAQKNGLAALFPFLPAATDAAIADIDHAIAILGTLPQGSLIIADIFKTGIFLTASTALRAKKLDLNGDGTLSTDELLNISTLSAQEILNNLTNAASAFGASAEYTDAAKNAQSKVDDIQTKISAQSGSTNEEKLKNYLASQGTAP